MSTTPDAVLRDSTSEEIAERAATDEELAAARVAGRLFVVMT